MELQGDQQPKQSWKRRTTLKFTLCTYSFLQSGRNQQSGTAVGVDRGHPNRTESRKKPISVQFSCSVMSDFLRTHELQHARLPCPSPTPRACSNSCPSSQWCHPTISTSVIPFSSHLQSFPASGSFQMSQFFASGLEFQLQHQSFQWIFRTDILQDGLVGSPCSSRDSQESSPAPQFKSINSSVLSFLYSPTLTSIHDYWKNDTFE